MAIDRDIKELAAIAVRLSELEIREEEKFSLLGALMDLERVLDNGRILIPVSDSRDTISEVNLKMDELRKNIRSQIDLLPKAEVVEYMKARARNVEFQFTV